MAWPGHRLALTLFAVILVGWIAVMAVLMRQAALPAEATGPMLVVFKPGTEGGQILEKIVNAGARPIRPTAFGFIWVVAGDEPGTAGRLADQGALGAYKELPLSPTIAGCFALADATVVNAFSL